jgi:hypothetical protein
MPLVRIARSQLSPEQIWERMLNVRLLSRVLFPRNNGDPDGKHQRLRPVISRAHRRPNRREHVQVEHAAPAVSQSGQWSDAGAIQGGQPGRISSSESICSCSVSSIVPEFPIGIPDQNFNAIHELLQYLILKGQAWSRAEVRILTRALPAFLWRFRDSDALGKEHFGCLKLSAGVGSNDSGGPPY